MKADAAKNAEVVWNSTLMSFIKSFARALALWAFLSGTAVSQVGITPRSGPNHQINNAPPYLRIPIDEKANSLPPGFRGHDPRAIVDAIAALHLKLVKSEFETSEQFQRRRAETETQPFLGSLTLSSDLGFLVKTITDGSSPGIKAEYDADSKTLTISLFAEDHTFGSPDGIPTLKSIALREDTVSHGKRVGMNSLGARAEFVSHYGKQYGIAFDGEGWGFPKEDTEITHSVASSTLHMDAAEARRVKPRLAAVAICELQIPSVLQDAYGRDATIDNRLEYTVEQNYLMVQLRQVWFIDFDSGRILSKIEGSALSNPAIGSSTLAVSISRKEAEQHLLSQVAPEYPELARQARVQGEVLLKVRIDPEGKVVDAHVIDGHPFLVQSAIAAVSRRIYRPFMIDKVPTSVTAEVLLKFTLTQ